MDVDLLTIRLKYNKLTCEVPFQLGGFSKLSKLTLAVNNLVRGVPSSLEKVSSLWDLLLSRNH